MNQNTNPKGYDQTKKDELTKQAKIANEYAAFKRKESYGVGFTVHLENKRFDEFKTEYGLKTVQDLINLINQRQNLQTNYLAFDSPQGNNILSHAILLKDLNDVYLKNISSENMAYIHVFGKKNVCTYYVNKKQTTVENIIDQFNNDQENQNDKIDTKKDKYGVGCRLEPGMQINDSILKSLISNYVEEGEGLIRILPY
ncbi:unnamed protein product [Paramecium sonneborni]|uniref:Uncharacterized protein n=1 Tax=Paramecium sonneborni TaxID=65129 RepID=A0A8S1N085_9CILI|nr:unnamed protein product [Paramecium sonneborni]